MNAPTIQNFDPISQPPILITAAARSGSSLIAGCVALCGAFGGITRGATVWNRSGMWENARIVNTISKPYLRDLGMDPMGQYPLPDVNNLPIPTDWRRRVEQVMVEEGYPGSGPWYYKGCKMAAVWPIWAYHFPRARWIIVRRRSGDIATSCMKTKFMTAFARKEVQRAVGVDNERDGWLFWVNQHLARFREMHDQGCDIKMVWPERAVDGDFSELKELMDWCRLPWNPAILEFVDRQLWKSPNKK
jgi:hypothetical protein